MYRIDIGLQCNLKKNRKNEGGRKKRNEKKSHKIVKMIPMEVDGNKAGQKQ